ncbi:MAG: EamA family transporter [Fimbriimonas sp.]|nr:EamA family transporter [Fimbriimonas sp.]
MSPLVVAAVLLSASLHAGWNALLRQSSDRQWTVGWIGVSTLVVSGPLLPLIRFPTTVWPMVLASSSLHVLYLMLLAKAYEVNELSFAYPIARGSSPILVSTGGFLLASERPGALQAIGIASIVGGIIGLGLGSKHWDRTGLLIALAIGCVIAIYTVIDGMAARRSGMPTEYNLWCFSVYGLAVLAIQLKNGGHRALHGSRKDVVLAFGGGVTSVVAYAIVTWAMARSPMGMVSALRETSTLFATAIGIVILRERFSRQKLACCAAIAAGAIMIGIG